MLAAAFAIVSFRGCGPTPPSFGSPADFAAWARANGLRVFGDHVDSPYAVLASGGADLEGSTFNAPGPGVIAVVRIHPSTPRPDRPYRVWGNVVAYGDAALLEKVEALR